jgi:hypothetical protein|tara:strand:- start:1224 stop:2135 length:912 start_codon:yes stop_codon:yes gene_type:complete
MNKPNFIITGFPKCGSTALHYYVDAHPDIFMPNKKELHYFTQSNISKLNKGPGDVEAKKGQVKNLDSYLELYKNVTTEKTIGETSPSYINYPSCYEQINKTLENPKIIILLRDPIKRAYSNYLHLLREQRETESFSKSLDLEDTRKSLGYSDFWLYTFNSFYYDKIIEAKKIFSEVLIVSQEELNSDTIKTLAKVYEFLGVNSEFIPSNSDNRYNKGGLYKKNLITNFIFKQGIIKTVLKKFIGISPWMKKIKNSIISNYHYQANPIDVDTENKLVNLFKKEVINLSNIGVDTSMWNKKFFNK